MAKKRIQLTLFVEENESESIEGIRREFNPEQFEIIKSHVTLCREEELIQIENVLHTLVAVPLHAICIDLGAPVRFPHGNGIFIPVTDGYEQFKNLREIILQGVIKKPTPLQPHITLMHTRNSTSTDSIFEQILNIKLPTQLVFKKISLIEQERGYKWIVLKEFELALPETG